MSTSGNLGQHPDIHYAPFEAGGSSTRMVRRPQPTDERPRFRTLSSETEQHLQHAHTLLAQLRLAVRWD